MVRKNSLLNGGEILSDAVISRHENIVASQDGKIILKHSPITGSVFVYTDNDFTGQEVQGSVSDNVFTANTRISKQVKPIMLDILKTKQTV